MSTWKWRNIRGGVTAETSPAQEVAPYAAADVAWYIERRRRRRRRDKMRNVHLNAIVAAGEEKRMAGW